MNIVQLRGGLTRDVEIRYLPNTEMPIVEMTVAVNGTRWSAKENKHIVTTAYIACKAFGWLANEIADLGLVQGEEVYIVGELDQRTIEKNDGTKESKTTVTVITLTPTRRKPPARPLADGGEPF